MDRRKLHKKGATPLPKNASDADASTVEVPAPKFFETHAEWLARRVKETGSKGVNNLKLGNPPGSLGAVGIPSSWTLDDIDTAVAYGAQAEVEPK